MSDLFAPVERSSAQQIVAGRLKDAIMNGDIPRGSKLPSERELALQMQVSRPVIREAIVVLSSYGLIVSRQGEGNFVADKFSESVLGFMGFSHTLTRENYGYFFDCRLLFEKGMADTILQNATAEGIQKLKEINEIFNREASEEEYVQAEVDFHHGFMEMSGNPLTLELYTMILKFMHVSASYLLKREGIRKEAFTAHGKIISALEEKNGERCIQAIEEHLGVARKNLQNYFEREDSGSAT